MAVVTVKERPILFSAPMVRALLAGAKTQTRCVMKPQPVIADPESYGGARLELGADGYGGIVQENVNGTYTCPVRCPYGAPGDRLWVRESWSLPVGLDKWSPSTCAEKCLEAGYLSPWSPIRFVADGYEHGADMLRDFGGTWGKPRSSIHMPRWASRIDLEVADVRVERLQAITEEDARAEGVQPAPFCKAGRPAGMEHVEAFENLWREINGAESWDANPWVWAITFKRVRP